MSKYNNRLTTVDNRTFHSAAEARRYQELRLLVAGHVIRDLRLQPRYPLLVNGEIVGAYVGDFEYTEVATGAVVLEDTKGFATPLYKLKKKLVKAIYGIDILET